MSLINPINCGEDYSFLSILKKLTLKDSDGNSYIRTNGLSAPVPPPSFCAAYQAVYDAYVTKPDIATAMIWNDLFICPLVASGDWALLDYLNVYAVHTNGASEALVNWKNPGTLDASLIGAPAFVANEGFTGGAGKAINTNWIPATHGVNYTLNSASFGCYIRTNTAAGDFVEMGVTSGGNRWMNLTARYTGDLAYVRVNTATAGSGSAASSDARGMWIAYRTAVNVNNLDRNSANIITDTDASDTLATGKVYALAYNNIGVIGLPSDRQFSMAFMGGGGLDRVYVTSCFESAMDALGKGIIP